MNWADPTIIAWVLAGVALAAAAIAAHYSARERATAAWWLGTIHGLVESVAAEHPEWRWDDLVGTVMDAIGTNLDAAAYAAAEEAVRARAKALRPVD